jgi:hypothetical protein
MKKSTSSYLETMLYLDYSREDRPWITREHTLRMLIGILGMALPLLLYVFLLIASGQAKPLHSISHYYFTRVAGIFVVILGLLALFLIVYKGKKPMDFIISTAAGLFALCVIFFPTGNISDICLDPDKKYSVTILQASNPRETFHYVSAAIFLLCLAFMSFFLFTKSNKSPGKRGPRKILRNRIYRTCGVFIVVPILVILFGSFDFIVREEWLENYQLTFWMETVAVESFGVAWLIKGEALFRDRPMPLKS